MEEFLTSRDVGQILNLCPDTIRQLVRLGKLKPVAIAGRMRLFDSVEVLKLKQKRDLQENKQPKATADTAKTGG